MTDSASPAVTAWLDAWPCAATERARDVEARITRVAQELTCEGGLDGFTMDDLAAAVGVSRRTVFNHFPSKLDAVLGNPPPFPAGLIEEFVAGRPHGHLVRDLGALIAGLIASDPHSHEDAVRLPVLLRDHRLMGATHARFADAAERMSALTALRGDVLDERQARLLVMFLLSVVKESLDLFVADEERDLSTLFLELLEETLGLMA